MHFSKSVVEVSTASHKRIYSNVKSNGQKIVYIIQHLTGDKAIDSAWDLVIVK